MTSKKLYPKRKGLLNKLIDFLRDGSIDRAMFNILSKRAIIFVYLNIYQYVIIIYNLKKQKQ